MLFSYTRDQERSKLKAIETGRARLEIEINSMNTKIISWFSLINYKIQRNMILFIFHIIILFWQGTKITQYKITMKLLSDILKDVMLIIWGSFYAFIFLIYSIFCYILQSKIKRTTLTKLVLLKKTLILFSFWFYCCIKFFGV